MKILITGATGLVGQVIVKELKNKGIPINYLSTSKEKIVSEETFQGFYWDPAKGEMDIAALDGVTGIINLAGATISKKWTASYKELVLQSRIDSLRTLKLGIQNLKNHDIQALVSASAIGIYPNSLTTLYEEHETKVDSIIFMIFSCLRDCKITTSLTTACLLSSSLAKNSSLRILMATYWVP